MNTQTVDQCDTTLPTVVATTRNYSNRDFHRDNYYPHILRTVQFSEICIICNTLTIPTATYACILLTTSTKGS
jgi:hypothetical protein